MGRVRRLRTDLTLDHHLTLGLELGAIACALRDCREILRATEGSGSAPYTAMTHTIAALKGLAVILDRQLRDAYGDRVEVRKTYQELLG